MRGNLGVVVLLTAPVFVFAQSPTVGTGALTVRVTRAGGPVSNATVCVGTSSDRNLFFQATTNSEGRVNFPQVPGAPFVLTARSGSGGAQQSFSPASPSGLSLLSVTLALPAAGGPSCPSTPPGPARTSLPRGFEVSTRPAVGFRQLQRNEHCFGAIGAQCGQPQSSFSLAALCSGGFCFVNGGSWEHDECCFRNPRGMACQMGPLDAVTGHDGNCVASWDKAVRLTTKGLSWRRDVDFARTNSTGVVEFNLYCAPSNTLLPPEDAAKCCSGQTRALTATERIAAAAARETLTACR